MKTENETCRLPLNSDGSRYVIVTAPASITAAEMERLTNWIRLQILVCEEERAAIEL